MNHQAGKLAQLAIVRNSPPAIAAPHSLCGNGIEGGSEFRLRVGRVQRHSPQNCLPSAMAASAVCDASDGERVHLYSPRDGAIPFAPPPRCRRPDADVCLSAAHSLSILQFKRAFLSCLPLPLSGRQEPVWHYGSFLPPSSCLPPFTSLSLPSQSPFAIAGFFTSEPN